MGTDEGVGFQKVSSSRLIALAEDVFVFARSGVNSSQPKHWQQQRVFMRSIDYQCTVSNRQKEKRKLGLLAPLS